MFKCPCSKNISYQACCSLYHRGKNAENALLLMKSRYSAYAMGKMEYIIKTTHPNCFPKEDFVKARQKMLQDIRYFCEQTTFQELTIEEFTEEKKRAYVSFYVKLLQGEKDVSFFERSLFLKEGGLWFYIEGEVKSSASPLFDCKKRE